MYKAFEISVCVISALMLICTNMYGQNAITDLYGFRIGQYRETTENELGYPLVQDVFEDGYEYQIHLLKPDSSMYIVFEFAPNQKDLIWSIQVSGSEENGKVGLNELRIGDSKEIVEKVFGKATSVSSSGEIELWSYENLNCNFEFLIEGGLFSVKIFDNFSSQIPDIKALPNFKEITTALQSKKNSDLSKMLSPGIEIYHNNQTLFFSRSINTEIDTDFSGVFAKLRQLSVGLNKINPKDEAQYEENMRIRQGKNPMHVVKIKKGHTITELVFEYYNGQYLLWEVHTK